MGVQFPLRALFLEMLTMQLDIANYRQALLEDGNVYVEFQWPEHVREEREQEALDLVGRTSLTTLPHRCWKILSGESSLPAKLAADQLSSLRNRSRPDA